LDPKSVGLAADQHRNLRVGQRLLGFHCRAAARSPPGGRARPWKSGRGRWKFSDGACWPSLIRPGFKRCADWWCPRRVARTRCHRRHNHAIPTS